jgi:hypothetical protein
MMNNCERRLKWMLELKMYAIAVFGSDDENGGVTQCTMPAQKSGFEC